MFYHSIQEVEHDNVIVINECSRVQHPIISMLFIPWGNNLELKSGVLTQININEFCAQICTNAQAITDVMAATIVYLKNNSVTESKIALKEMMKCFVVSKFDREAL